MKQGRNTVTTVVTVFLPRFTRVFAVTVQTTIIFLQNDTHLRLDILSHKKGCLECHENDNNSFSTKSAVTALLLCREELLSRNLSLEDSIFLFNNIHMTKGNALTVRAHWITLVFCTWLLGWYFHWKKREKKRLYCCIQSWFSFKRYYIFIWFQHLDDGFPGLVRMSQQGSTFFLHTH